MTKILAQTTDTAFSAGYLIAVLVIAVVLGVVTGKLGEAARKQLGKK